VNKVVLHINNHYRKNIKTINLSSESNTEFQEDFEILNNEIIQSIEDDSISTYLDEIDSIRNQFFAKLRTLQIHLVHACYCDENFQPLVNLFYRNVLKSFSIVEKPRKTLDKYLEILTDDGLHLACFYKLAFITVVEHKVPGTDYREEDLYDYLRNKEPAVEEFQEIIKSQINQALVAVYFISKFHI